MIIDWLLIGIASIIGFEMTFLFYMFFCLLIMGLNKGVGMVAMVTMYIMTVWFYFTYPVQQIYLISQPLAIGVLLVFGFIIGFLVFEAFYRY